MVITLDFHPVIICKHKFMIIWHISFFNILIILYKINRSLIFWKEKVLFKNIIIIFWCLGIVLLQWSLDFFWACWSRALFSLSLILNCGCCCCPLKLAFRTWLSCCLLKLTFYIPYSLRFLSNYPMFLWMNFMDLLLLWLSFPLYSLTSWSKY